MNVAWPYIVVFLLAATPMFEIIGVIPLAIIAGLSPIPVALLAFLGNLLTVLLVIFLVDKLKAWMLTRKAKKNPQPQLEGSEFEDSASDQVSVEEDTKRSKRAKKIWEKYGLPGLAILGPLLIGSHIAAFMAMSFGSKRSWVTGWMTASLILWSVVAVVATSLGLELITDTTGTDSFLIDLFK
ncbi:small multi-drug export protein [Metabacillus herbersteinensis]|uniref:Small multi-drug export protein n=1 Tax=Metabacillus herbersteinensis TaxID=283816 RepID=A0ABV6GI08_9BACI